MILFIHVSRQGINHLRNGRESITEAIFQKINVTNLHEKHESDLLGGNLFDVCVQEIICNF